MKACLEGEALGALSLALLATKAPGCVFRVCGLPPGERWGSGEPRQAGKGREGRPLTAEQMLVIL